MYHLEADFPLEQVHPLAQREANAKRPIYMLHKWWARRLGCVFRTLVLSALIPDEEWQRLDAIARRQGVTAWHWLYYRQCHFGRNDGDHTGHGCAVERIDRYCRDKVVLDPFMGGGTTVVEALRLGCRVIGLDVNPVAWFVVKKSVEPVDLRKLEEAFQRLEAEVAPEILKWYRTRCPHGDHEADVMYVFWVKAVRCSSCGQRTRLFNSFRLATRKGEEVVFCPACYAVFPISHQPSAISHQPSLLSRLRPPLRSRGRLRLRREVHLRTLAGRRPRPTDRPAAGTLPARRAVPPLRGDGGRRGERVPWAVLSGLRMRDEG